MTTIAIIALITMCIVSVASLIVADRILKRAAEDQQRLLDRIQARDLPEYKALETPAPTPKQPSTEPQDELEQL